jgi:hypothetical protein
VLHGESSFDCVRRMLRQEILGLLLLKFSCILYISTIRIFESVKLASRQQYSVIFENKEWASW